MSRFVITVWSIWALLFYSCPADAVSPAVGQSLDNFQLMNQDGIPVHLADFQGKTVLMSFIYTRCPMPTMCPLITSKMAGIQKMINQTNHDNVIFISITFDPEYDRPEVLKEYALKHQADLSNWDFLTGDQATIDAFTKSIGLVYEGVSDGMIGHNMQTLILSPAGTVHDLYQGSGWEVDKVYQALLALSNNQGKEAS